MIAVNVDQNGDLTRVTTRYNHDFNGENNPNLETTEQLENVLHVPFYQTFKPYTKAELLNKGVVPFDMVQQALDNGKTPQELFDEIYKVGDGINVVLYNDKYNFINSERKLLSPNLWFDNYGIFQNDFAPVQINEKWNYLTTKGKILSPNLWFDDIFPFANYKLAKVFLDGKYNLINSEGNLLSPNRWLDDISFPYYGFYVVQLDYYENWCGPNGILTSNQWYDKCYHFNKSGFALFKLDNKYNVINKDGKIMFPNIWFDDHFVPPNIGEIGLTKDGEVYIFTMGGKLERGDITQL